MAADRPDDASPEPPVDLVVDSASGPAPEDEELPQRPHREWPRLRAARRPVQAVLLVALAAVLGERLVTTGHGPSRIPAGAPPSHAATSAPRSYPTAPLPPGRLPPTWVPRPDHDRISFPRPDVVPMQTGGPRSRPVYGDPGTCQPVAACWSTHHLPAATLAAVRTLLPNARLGTASSLLVHGTAAGALLWSRTFTMTAGRRQVMIEVMQPDGSSHVQQSVMYRPSGMLIAVATAPSHGYTVRVTFTRPSSGSYFPEALRRLASDRRLVRVHG